MPWAIFTEKIHFAIFAVNFHRFHKQIDKKMREKAGKKTNETEKSENGSKMSNSYSARRAVKNSPKISSRGRFPVEFRKIHVLSKKHGLKLSNSDSARRFARNS